MESWQRAVAVAAGAICLLAASTTLVGCSPPAASPVITTTTPTTTTTATTTTFTSTSTTGTTTTTTISPDPIAGGAYTASVFWSWLYMWRKLYKDNNGFVPVITESTLPMAMRGIEAKIIVSSGGVAGGVVSEGMGYGIMVEGIQAAGGDKAALKYGLGLMKSWLGMVTGPPTAASHPYAGGNGKKGSATDVRVAPYGVSAVFGPPGTVPAGVPPWKYPINEKSCHGQCMGSATDGDEDAVLGMIYLAEALNYPDDFVDVVMRTLIAFTSADLGFPDLFRMLPDGSKVFVPKGGSQWGGITPLGGPFKTTEEAWCYGPSYFAPGHYRLFRDFARNHWKPSFDGYLPPHLNGKPSKLVELTEALNGAVVAGYNILYRSSCLSGSVSNWVGVKAECMNNGISCSGVPWANTPYVGTAGKCAASGTKWGAYGADASRTPWRIAMDYVLYTEESFNVPMYDAAGKLDPGLAFNAKVYLNRIANQYKEEAKCDGGLAEEDLTWKNRCFDKPQGSPYRLASAYDMKPQHGKKPPNVVCSNVPEEPLSWWGPLLSYPTFTAFVAPFERIPRDESSRWMDTFSSICNFTSGDVKGDICKPEYFAAGQEVISTMLMAGAFKPLPSMPQAHPPHQFTQGAGHGLGVSTLDDLKEEPGSHDTLSEAPVESYRLAMARGIPTVTALLALAGLFLAVRQRLHGPAADAAGGRRGWSLYARLQSSSPPGPAAAADAASQEA